MEFKVILMPAAIKDLEEITGHIAKDDDRVAERFGNELIDQTLPLAMFPEMGRVVPEFDDLTIREIIHDPYRIIYRVRRKIGQIHVLRFWHAARGEPFIQTQS
jgi:toxin ParE1/3/4